MCILECLHAMPCYGKCPPQATVLSAIAIVCNNCDQRLTVFQGQNRFALEQVHMMSHFLRNSLALPSHSLSAEMMAGVRDLECLPCTLEALPAPQVIRLCPHSA